MDTSGWMVHMETQSALGDGGTLGDRSIWAPRPWPTVGCPL